MFWSGSVIFINVSNRYELFLLIISPSYISKILPVIEAFTFWYKTSHVSSELNSILFIEVLFTLFISLIFTLFLTNTITFDALNVPLALYPPFESSCFST